MIQPSTAFWSAEGYLAGLFVNMLFAFISRDKLVYGIYLLISFLAVGPVAFVAYPVLFLVVWISRQIWDLFN